MTAVTWAREDAEAGPESAKRRQILDGGRGQRIGFQIEALMHSVRRQPFGDR